MHDVWKRCPEGQRCSRDSVVRLFDDDDNAVPRDSVYIEGFVLWAYSLGIYSGGISTDHVVVVDRTTRSPTPYHLCVDRKLPCEIALSRGTRQFHMA